MTELLAEHGVQIENDDHKKKPVAEVEKDANRDMPVVVTVAIGGSTFV
jgi:hypothetical protein